MKKFLTFEKDRFLFLFVNFFLLDWKITVFSLLIALFIGYSFDVKNPLSEEILAGLACFILAFFAIFKIIILPITYRYFEKHSNSVIVVNFIKRLKSSWKLKLIMLILTSISPIFFMLIMTFPSEDQLKFAFLSFPFMLSSPSYLALFLWWWIEDLIKKRKMQRLVL